MRVFEGSGQNRYAVEKLLKSAGQGRVYQVTNQADGRQYALKWYHPASATAEQRVRLLRLVRQGAALAKITFTYMGNSAGAEVHAPRP